MLKAFFLFTFRNLFRQKKITFINVSGLAIGLAASFIMMIFVYHEYSYDKHNDKLDRIFRVNCTYEFQQFSTPNTPYLLGHEIRETIPQVEKVARIYTRIKTSVVQNNDLIKPEDVLFTETDIFDIFTFDILYGNVNNIFEKPDNIAISANFAEKIFGTSSCEGKMIPVIVEGKEQLFRIAAVYSDIPATSTLQADIIFPISLVENIINNQWSFAGDDAVNQWRTTIFSTYLLLNDATSPEEVESLLPEFPEKSKYDKLNYVYYLQPTEDIYLHSGDLLNNYFATGNYTNMIVYSAVALLILLVACLNFIILSSASGLIKTKEIGILKLVGAGNGNVFLQLVGETLATGLIALFFSAILVEIFLDSLTAMLGNLISIDYLHQFEFYIFFIVITVFISILTGSFVAFKFSRLQPVDIFRKKHLRKNSKLELRHSLLIVQMIIFIGLIASSAIIQKQIYFFFNKDFGYNKEELISIPVRGYMNAENYSSFVAEVGEIPGVLNAAGTSEALPTINWATSFMPYNDDPENGIDLQHMSVDYNFIETMGLELIEGRSFSRDFVSETGEAYTILNETAVRALRLGDERTLMNGEYKIIGVLKDFHIQSLHSKIAPTKFSIGKTKYMRYIIARLMGQDMVNTIEQIENKWNEFVPDKPMPLQFFDERLNEIYGDEIEFAKLMRYFTLLAVFISCMGLLGLVIFISEQRTKEIGIRRVLGASRGRLWFAIVKEFIAVTIVAGIIGVTLSYYLLQQWLSNFAYQASLEWWIFAGSLMLALIIIISTISVKIFQVANINPVDTLRDE